MLSCPDRQQTCAQTVANLAMTDWGEPVCIELDITTFERRQERQETTARLLLEHATSSDADVMLFLEDDLEFATHLRHNLENWAPLQALGPEQGFFASLYNPNVRMVESHLDRAFSIADPASVYGAQAFVLSPNAVRYVVAHWHEVEGMWDIKVSRLAARLGPIHYHVPSLVQHVGTQSVWGGVFHTAQDFDRGWQAPESVTSHLPVAQMLSQMREIEGWFNDPEAELLISAVRQQANRHPGRINVVEVGSYCGRSTVVLGLALRELDVGRARVYAIDPHHGQISTLNQDIVQTEPTYERFSRNIADARIADLVTPIVAYSTEVVWDKPVDLLFIDGWHDYEHVAADFQAFSPWLGPDSLVAFHDCADYFPGVKRFVSELLDRGTFRLVRQANSLALLQPTRAEC